MTCIYRNRECGLPHEQYPKEAIAEAIRQLQATIGLASEPVGVTLLFSHESFEAHPLPVSSARMPYCVMVKRAALEGKAMKSTLENHTCDGGTTALALEPSTQRIESGEEYFSYNLYSSVAVARRHRNAIRSLHRLPVSTYGIAVSPLRDCMSAPDVIIMMTNSLQTMRLVQGYTYFTGCKPDVDLGAMQAMCSELTASPYLSGEMNVSVLCPSTRMLCNWDDNQMGVAVPYELFESTVAGVVATVMEY